MLEAPTTESDARSKELAGLALRAWQLIGSEPTTQASSRWRRTPLFLRLMPLQQALRCELDRSEWVLDLVGDASGRFVPGRQLLSLDELREILENQDVSGDPAGAVEHRRDLDPSVVLVTFWIFSCSSAVLIVSSFLGILPGSIDWLNASPVGLGDLFKQSKNVDGLAVLTLVFCIMYRFVL